MATLVSVYFASLHVKCIAVLVLEDTIRVVAAMTSADMC